jgi:hypothetical protein
MPSPDATRKEIDDLMKYDGVYHKITAHNIECNCFCSMGDCVKDFDTIGEIVIQTWGNLFHIKCFGEGHNIKKPSFYEDDFT